MQNPLDSKWQDAEYNAPFQQWTPPSLVYPVSDTEKNALHALKAVFETLPIYPDMERQASEKNELVRLDAPIPEGYIAFLENTAEQCTSPQTKHSQEGMQGARHWVQRVDTPAGMFQRLTDGYGVSLMFGERHYQYIRNRNNWRGISGMMLDIDVFKDEKNPDAPEPCYSESELFDRFPLLAKICTYLIPSASSLYDGRPFKARGIILFSEPITDQRIYRAFGDILLSELDCIPANVTKNPVAVGFGNTHNASQAYQNETFDTVWVTDALAKAKSTTLTVATKRNKEQKHKAELREHYSNNSTRQGENISEFINTCDAVREMVRDGLLTPGRGNEYRWHESENDRSCELMGDGVFHIFSHKMQDASPAGELEPVNVHRFYLYQLSGLDLAKESDKAKCREYLFERGYGSDPKAQAKAKAKLKQKNDAETEPTETLAENRDNRADATDAFLETETENLHIMLVKDSTGTGKSHTVIGKAYQHGKRTLAQLPHTDLAKQAVNTAYEIGYTNPYHLTSREHNWDASGIAGIPVSERTSDLFSQNNCIMVDEVKKYTDKRLSPRTYCYHKCPFAGKRDTETGKMHLECPHLLQYEALGDRDFVASCAPNLLFDLNFRGYLKSLVTATSEPTDEELAFDAMLGTQSEETTAFDFAIVDDYGVSRLYSDVSLAEKEFKALKKAWHGTPVADFAKGILKAFKKKKPHAIVKALRKAFESTTEHHKEIAESLTKHARNGVVEHAEHPKSSKESQRLLSEKQVRYADGGTQFIPVDIDAFLELREKGIPTIHPKHLETTEVGASVRIPHTPVHALIAGVPLDALTPLWQSGATPIELLKIFLDFIGNDKNAPINRTFRASDPPEAVLTFSIPPQAPVGILNNIAMLSATTEPDDVKATFDGQAVTFSEHIGGLVELADGVQIYQFTDARLTSASVFEYPKDTDGKRKLQETPIGLKPTAEKRLAKLNDWAKTVDGLTAFISYKEFTEPFGEVVNGFDIVTHFDKVSGLNFDGLKFLVVFGYPKVKHDVVMNHARVQHASDTEPLPKADPNLRDENGKPISEYMQLTEDITATENGYTIAERRYKDPRLEKIRHQLATEKLDQSLGRARFSTWTDTTTIAFTNAPIDRITQRAKLFSSHAFNLSETPNGLSDAMERIDKAEQSGDVKAVMETKGVSERTAYRDPQRKQASEQEKAERDAEIIRLHRDGISQREIHRQVTDAGFKVSLGKINAIITAFRNCQDQLDIPNWQCQKLNTSENRDDTCLADKSESTPVKSNDNGAPKQNERPRPAWHDDPFYSADAIHERMKAAKAALQDTETGVESNIMDVPCDAPVETPPVKLPEKLNGVSHDPHPNGNGKPTPETEKQEVYRLYNEGMSKSDISELLTIDRLTIDKYLSAFDF